MRNQHIKMHHITMICKNLKCNTDHSKALKSHLRLGANLNGKCSMQSAERNPWSWTSLILFQMSSTKSQ